MTDEIDLDDVMRLALPGALARPASATRAVGLLSGGMRDLSVEHGGPLRLRLEPLGAAILTPAR